MPLLLAASAAKDLKASRVGLVAPYLAYMRQDDRFQPGEGVTSAYYARILSAHFDWLVTVDPHLHRYASLSEIYSIPTRTLHAAPAFSEWILRHVETPLLIGPDAESEQWVAAVANGAGAPHSILQKTRRGDREVDVGIPDVESYRSRTPVLVDDIISTGRTLIAASRRLRALGFLPPVCIGVHAIFAESAYAELRAEAGTIVTTNTIPHPTNGIDLTKELGEALLTLTR